MPFSDPEFSDTSEREDLPNQSDAKSQPSSPAAGVTYPSVSGTNVEYPIPQLGGNAMGQAAYPYPHPYYRSIFAPYETQPYVAQPYPAQSMVHLQLMGIQRGGIPLPSDAVEEPVFVNAKQYHGILRRRQSRAKAESENKAHKSRKTYLHESRHLHAVRRARGSGGRFQRKEEQQKDVASKSNS